MGATKIVLLVGTTNAVVMAEAVVVADAVVGQLVATEAVRNCARPLARMMSTLEATGEANVVHCFRDFWPRFWFWGRMVGWF